MIFPNFSSLKDNLAYKSIIKGATLKFTRQSFIDKHNKHAILLAYGAKLNGHKEAHFTSLCELFKVTSHASSRLAIIIAVECYYSQLSTFFSKLSRMRRARLLF